MNFESYDMQILRIVAKNCRPNSPRPERAWYKPAPIYGLPEFGDALSRLLRDDLLLRKNGLSGYSVKPSAAGYAAVVAYKVYRRELKCRPVLFDPVIWEPRAFDFQQAA